MTMGEAPHHSQDEDPSAPRADGKSAPKMNIAGLRHGPVMLLVGLLVIHAYAVHGHNGDPWRFGGYGMFAVPETRYVDAKILDEQGRSHHLSGNRIWRRFPRRYSRVRVLPDTSALCALAERLAGLRWSAEKASDDWRLRDAVTKFNGATGQVSSRPIALDETWLARHTRARDSPNVIPIDRLEVSVAKIVFDREDNRTRRHPLASVVWTKDGVCLPH